MKDQLELALDWGEEPWSGFSPRSLSRGYLRDVDKSDTLAEAARRIDLFRDPHQLQLWVSTSFSVEVPYG